MKQVAHTRKTLTDAGDVLEEQRTLTIDVQPGLPDGTCFVFEGEGHKTPMNAPGELRAADCRPVPCAVQCVMQRPLRAVPCLHARHAGCLETLGYFYFRPDARP